MYLHLMSQNKCDIIDDFILRRIDFNTFKQFLDKEMAWVKVSTGNQQGVSDALQKLW